MHLGLRTDTRPKLVSSAAANFHRSRRGRVCNACSQGVDTFRGDRRLAITGGPSHLSSWKTGSIHGTRRRARAGHYRISLRRFTRSTPWPGLVLWHADWAGDNWETQILPIGARPRVDDPERC